MAVTDPAPQQRPLIGRDPDSICLQQWERSVDTLFETLRDGVTETADLDARLAVISDEVSQCRRESVSSDQLIGLTGWVRAQTVALNRQLDIGVSDLEETRPEQAIRLGLAMAEEGRWLRVLMARNGKGRIDATMLDIVADSRALSAMCDGEELATGSYHSVSSLSALSAIDDDRNSDDSEPADCLPNILRGTAAALLDVEVESLTARLDTLIQAASTQHGSELVELLAVVEDVADDCAALAQRAMSARVTALRERADAATLSLEARVTDELEHEDQDRASEMACALALHSVERSDEAFVVTADMDPGQSRVVLNRSENRARHVYALWKRLNIRGREPKEIKNLRSSIRRLRVEAQEQGLQSKLEGRFGKRFVSFFESLILWLIFLVVGLLIVEATASLTPGASSVFAWLDFGICVVFLVEFFTKLSMVPGARWRWFGRHFLVDFVPSIPFGVIAQGMAGFDVMRGGRLARLLRLNRLARYIRVLRPVIRLFRVVAFMLRGLDRMIQRHSHVLNRDILLFSQRYELDVARLTTLRDAVHEADRRAALQLLVHLQNLHRERREPAVRRAMAQHAGDVGRIRDWVLAHYLEPPMAPVRNREVRIETLLAQLHATDSAAVRRRLGVDLTRRLARKMKRLDLPFLRDMPFLRRFVPYSKRSSDGEIVAKAARALGGLIQRQYDRALRVSDLTGVISGPQMLDRVGGTLARATGVHARRLLLFGGGFLIVYGMVKVLGFSLLHSVMQGLSRLMGTPLLVLGGSCLVIFLTGVWFQRIAGEATEILERTAEAQYLNLLKVVKRTTLRNDLAFLDARVLSAERSIARSASPVGVDELEAALQDWQPAALRGTRRHLRERQRVLGLFRDYLDGAIMHRSDHKSTQQLLGNLAIRTLLERRLRLDKADLVRLRRLDLSTESGFGGPYFWFFSITRTVAQRTAELLLEYNRHAVPIAERDRLSDDERHDFENWLENRAAGKPLEDKGVDIAYRTTAFTALHFLSPEPKLERGLATEFGDELVSCLKRDRMRMIREIFGTYPLHQLPRERRTLNPYALYRRYVAGFRVFTLPLVFIWLYVRFGLGLTRRFWQIVKEVRRPELVSEERGRAVSDFDTAIRKISRMRQSAFVESAWIRALVDPEYLGLPLPCEDQSFLKGQFDDDLVAVGASVYYERQRFVELRTSRRREFAILADVLANRGISERDVSALFPDRGGQSSGQTKADAKASNKGPNPRLVLRAIAVGFAADDRNCRSLLSAEQLIASAIRTLQTDPKVVPYRGPLQRLFDGCCRVASWVVPKADRVRLALDRYLEHMGEPLLRSQRRRILKGVRSNYENLAEMLVVVSEEDAIGRTTEVGFERLQEVAHDYARISEELVAMRTVQSLTVLDIRNYQNLICELGGYTAEEGGSHMMSVDGMMVTESLEG